MSVLFCDSNCELWYDKAEALGLSVISMPYTLDGKEYYYDLGKATDFKFFYDRVRAKSRPTTSALNEQDYIDYFEPVFARGEDIFYITFSHEMSATFQFMDKAVATLKAKYPARRFTAFDSKSIAMGAGLQVYYAAKLWKEGATDEQLLEFLKEFSSHSRVFFAVDDLFHLKRGGRLSGAAAAVGTLLGVKPILTINKEGKLNPEFKVKGTKMVMQKLASLVAEEGADLDKYDVFVLSADCDVQANELKAKVEELTHGRARVSVQTVGPVIATHCGPGTLGVVFHSK